MYYMKIIKYSFCVGFFLRVYIMQTTLAHTLWILSPLHSWALLLASCHFGS